MSKLPEPTANNLEKWNKHVTPKQNQPVYKVVSRTQDASPVKKTWKAGLPILHFLAVLFGTMFRLFPSQKYLT